MSCRVAQASVPGAALLLLRGGTRELADQAPRCSPTLPIGVLAFPGSVDKPLKAGHGSGQFRHSLLESREVCRKRIEVRCLDAVQRECELRFANVLLLIVRPVRLHVDDRIFHSGGGGVLCIIG